MNAGQSLPMTDFAVQTLRAAERSARDAGRSAILPIDVIVGTLDRGRRGVGPVALQDVGVSREQARALAGETVQHRAADRASDDEALAAVGIDLDEVRSRVEAALGEGSLSISEPAIAPSEELVASARAAVEVATSIGQGFVGTEHLLLGVLAHDEEHGGRLTGLLGVSSQAIRERIFAGMAFVSFLFSAAGDRFIWDEVAEVRASVDALEGGAWDEGMALVRSASQAIGAALGAAYDSPWPDLPATLAETWVEHLRATERGDEEIAEARRSAAFAALQADPGATRLAGAFGQAARSEIAKLRTGVANLKSSGGTDA